MRRAAKIDRNHPEIVAALRAAGAFVQPLHAVGQGCPDLLAVFRGRAWLIEVKDGDLPPSARKLTPQQQDWHGAALCRGVRVIVALSSDDALRQMGALA